MSTAPSHEAAEGVLPQAKPPFLRRVRIRGYKSIVFCDVTLEPLTILVGRNASGKSNFLDALAFLRDLLLYGVAEAVKRHGGWDSIRCRTDETNRVAIQIEALVYCDTREMGSSEDSVRMTPLGPIGNYPIPTYQGKSFSVTYEIELGGGESKPVRILGESYGHEATDHSVQPVAFRVRDGMPSLKWHMLGTPPGAPFSHPPPLLVGSGARGNPLLAAVGNAPFVDLADGVRSIGCYNFHPKAIRQLNPPLVGTWLEHDGGNLAGVLQALARDASDYLRVQNYLSHVVPEIERVEPVRYGEFETVRFHLRPPDQGKPLSFDAAGMSDGTLRVLASLVAAFQSIPPFGYPALVGIEEPETALHPAAMRALVDALDEATLRTQVLLTTHSADMLDNPTIKPDNVRVVQMVDGRTVIGPVDEASVEIVARDLSTLGGLERENQLEPDPDDQERQQQLSHKGVESEG